MDRSPCPEPTPMDSPNGTTTVIQPAHRPRRSERWAWFACGAALALLAGMGLGPVFATPSPFGPAVAPALILPGSASAPLSPASAAPSFAAAPALAQNGNQSGLRPIPMTANGMSADSNNRMIAVTGVDITGQSVLYLVDTIDKQLAVYQAAGGAPGTNSIRLVGARRIDLDLQLAGFNDKTETGGKPLTYEDLEKRFSTEVDGR